MEGERDDIPVRPKRRRKRKPTRELSRERREAKWKKLDVKKRQRAGPRLPLRDPSIIAQAAKEFGAQLAKTATYLHDGAEDPGGSLALTNAAAWSVKEDLHREKARTRKTMHRPPRVKKSC